ncbi:MAG: hypothetical protein QNK04_33925 [Myxococcota bacterium]|nr:hypothetical protein [Myxococcota bacterium]
MKRPSSTLLWGLALALATLWTAPSHAEGRIRLAVLPVVVHSMGDGAYIREGLTDMLVSRLGRSPALAVIPIEDPSVATTKVDSARATATESGAEYVIYGSFTKFGEGASLDLRCAPVASDGGAPREVFVHSPTLAQLIPELDELVEKVTRYVVHAGDPAPAAASAAAAGGEAPADVSTAELQNKIDELTLRVEMLEAAQEAAAAEAVPEEQIVGGGAFSAEVAPN